MADVFGNRILGGIGAPDAKAARSFGEGVSTTLGQRQTRLGLDVTAQNMDVTAQNMRHREEEAARLRQKFGWDIEDRAANKDAAAFMYGDMAGGYTPPQAGVTVPGITGGSGGSMSAGPQLSYGGGYGPAPTGALPSGVTPTFGLTKHFEGYRATPYWDVNAYRGGFGSDTVTMADGSVVKVTPGMTITEEDAQRDFDRRMNTEFVPRAAKQVGEKVWASFPAHVVEALASVTYNYGSLPGNVVEAAKTGNPELIAQAIEARAGDNGGINAKRRMQEAAIVRSGGAIDPGLMRAAAAPVGAAGGSYIPDQSQRYAPMPRQPDQSQRYNPGDYIDALRGETRFAPDGSIDTAVPPQGRPGDYAARATAERLANPETSVAAELPRELYPTGWNGETKTTFTSADIPLLNRMKALLRDKIKVKTEARANGTYDPINSTDLETLIQQVGQIDALIERVGMVPGRLSKQRRNNSEEGPGSTIEATAAARADTAAKAAKAAAEAAAKAAATPATTTPATTTPAAATPAATTPATTAPATTAPAQAGLSFGNLGAAQDYPVGVTTEDQMPSRAGIAEPSPQTADIKAGATIETVKPEFPGLRALFLDAPMAANARADLMAERAALLRQAKAASITRDLATLQTIGGKVDILNVRLKNMDAIDAANTAAMTGNFAPLAAATSAMSGMDVKIVKSGDNTYNVVVDGAVSQANVPADFILKNFMYAVNDTYRAEVDAAKVAAQAATVKQAEYAAEQAKITLEAQLKYAGEKTIEEVKGEYALALAAQNPDFGTASITMPDQSTALMVFSKKNPNTPLTIVKFQTNSDGTIEPVQVPVESLMRN